MNLISFFPFDLPLHLALFNPSPFTNHEEFLKVKGPFYTFSHQPGVIAFLLILCALGSLYFIYASFAIKGEHAAPKSPVALGLLLALGLAGVANRVYSEQMRDSVRPTAQVTREAGSVARARDANGLLKPLALLGMLGGGATASRRWSGRRRSPAKRRVK